MLCILRNVMKLENKISFIIERSNVYLFIKIRICIIV